ncbi:hypothetical protein Agub_g2557 [Astrephomene gubernaculifera]|uniref:Smr domain-containing protein n=1 Tax=Astrephomene gubernaculifera TaxID=47775 RepID=A0AAD3DJB3_9CHLO|nr:hypothetical protein Agub_g2557 [Astrephomene gubernaculifera]
MLDVSAKEFVPAAVCRVVSSACAGVEPSIATPKDTSGTSATTAAKPNSNNKGTSNQSGSGCGAKPQLSITAPAFVPQGVPVPVPCPDASDPLPRTLPPPSNNRTAAPSTSPDSSSKDATSRAAAQGKAAEKSAAAATDETDGWEAGCQWGGFGTAVAEGGELSPAIDSNAYDGYEYAYGAYDEYGMPYTGAYVGSDGMYYTDGCSYDPSAYDGSCNVPYDAYQQPIYYWDDASSSYMYGSSTEGAYGNADGSYLPATLMPLQGYDYPQQASSQPPRDAPPHPSSRRPQQRGTATSGRGNSRIRDTTHITTANGSSSSHQPSAGAAPAPAPATPEEAEALLAAAEAAAEAAEAAEEEELQELLGGLDASSLLAAGLLPLNKGSTAAAGGSTAEGAGGAAGAAAPAAAAASASSAAASVAAEDDDDDEDAPHVPHGTALKILELFFPHYATGALRKLLYRHAGDLAASYGELAALERQLAAEGVIVGGGGGGNGQRPQQQQVRWIPRVGEGAGAVAQLVGSLKKNFRLDPEAFPTLSPSSSPQVARAPSLPAEKTAQDESAPDGAASVASSAPTEASQPASASATARIPALPSPSTSHPGKLNYAALLRTSAAASSSSTTPAQPQQQPPATSALAATTRAAVNGNTRGGSGGTAGDAVPRVSTGEAVAAQYAEARREAAMLARARNQYFQQATLAYLSGNKALAKQLGRKGREANEAMKAAHAAAARRIFAARNGGRMPGELASQQHSRKAAGDGAAAAAAAGSKRRGAGPACLFVDLHGLHAAEAVAALEEQIAAARAAGCAFMRVCTGTGSHTKGAKTPARLPAAVADTLLAHHITFKTLEPGLLEAKL